MSLFLVTFAAFCFIALIMAVGVIFKGRCLRGSCGGQAIVDENGDLLNCDTCPARKEREEQARAALEEIAAAQKATEKTHA